MAYLLSVFYILTFLLIWYERKFLVRVPAERPLGLRPGRQELFYWGRLGIFWITQIGIWYFYSFASVWIGLIPYFIFARIVGMYSVRQERTKQAERYYQDQKAKRPAENDDVLRAQAEEFGKAWVEENLALRKSSRY